MFPAVIFLVPLFILMRLLGLVNTHGSLILTYLTFGLPLAIWLLKGFYDNIPIQLEQAARIDGATRFQAFLLIVMPLSVPGIIATAIYSFIGAWNEYIYAYTFLTKNDQLTLPVGIQRFFSENTTDFPGPDGGELHDERAGRRAVPRPATILRARPHRRRGQTLGRQVHGPCGPQRSRQDLWRGLRRQQRVADRRGRRVRRARRPVGLRQDDDAQSGRRAHPDHRRRHHHRRPRGQRPRSEGPGHRHGVPELRALSAKDGLQEPRLPAADAQAADGRDRPEGARGRAQCSTSTHLLERKPRELSGGQQQRVALGRALVRDPARLPDGRAAVQPRRQAARADALRDQALPPGPQGHDHLRDARPARGRHHGRQDGRDERRLPAAIRHARRRSSPIR